MKLIRSRRQHVVWPREDLRDEKSLLKGRPRKNFFRHENIVHYLYEAGLLRSPRFFKEDTYHELPAFVGVSLRLIKHRNFLIQAKGASFHSVGEALSIAIGESLERLCLLLVGLKIERTCSINEISSQSKMWFDFRLDSTFTGGWFSFLQKYNGMKDISEVPLAWINMARLSDNKSVLLPAQYVSNNFEHFSIEPLLREINSNGYAGYFSRDRALVSGINELVERDAFLLHWLLMKSPRLLDLTTIEDESVLHVIERVEKYGLKIDILYTTVDIKVPSFLCCLRDKRGDTDYFALGSAAGFNIAQVLQKAILEALSTMTYQYANKQFNLPEDYVPFVNMNIDLAQRVFMWRDDMLVHLDFLFEGESISLEDIRSDCRWMMEHRKSDKSVLNDLVSHVHHTTGQEIFAYTFRTSWLRRCRYHVIKVYIPQLLDLYIKEHHAKIVSTRIINFKKRWGITPDQPLNPNPHPFP